MSLQNPASSGEAYALDELDLVPPAGGDASDKPTVLAKPVARRPPAKPTEARSPF